MINGLYRHGFMISPAVLDCALQILEQGSSKTALELGLTVLQDSNQVEAVCA